MWLALFLISISWLFSLPIYTAENYTVTAVLVAAGLASACVALRKSKVALAKLDWPKDGAAPQKFLVYEFWENKFVGEVENELAAELPPTACRVYAVRPACPHHSSSQTPSSSSGPFGGAKE